MQNLNFIIAKNLSALRKKNGLTQLELAQKLNYSDKAVSKWENGESAPTVEVLYEISKLYNVSLDSIVGQVPLNKEKNKSNRTRKNQLFITLLSILGVWFSVMLIYIILDICLSVKLWVLFCWAVPASAVVALVFDCVWNNHKLLFSIISLLVWSCLICFSVQFYSYSVWKILFIGIPSQLAIFLCSRLIKNIENKEK